MQRARSRRGAPTASPASAVSSASGNAICLRRAVAKGAAEARTGSASATKSGQKRPAAYAPRSPRPRRPWGAPMASLASVSARVKRIPIQVGTTSNSMSTRRAAATGAAEAATGPASATKAGQAQSVAYPPRSPRPRRARGAPMASLASASRRVKGIPTQVGATSNAMSTRRAAVVYMYYLYLARVLAYFFRFVLSYL